MSARDFPDLRGVSQQGNHLRLSCVNYKEASPVNESPQLPVKHAASLGSCNIKYVYDHFPDSDKIAAQFIKQFSHYAICLQPLDVSDID